MVVFSQYNQPTHLLTTKTPTPVIQLH